jgi:Flp pilus assembly protein TadG
VIRPRLGRDEHGQALVEFALVAILFFTLLMGIIEGSRAIYAYNTVANAARVGARTAIVNQDSDTVIAAAIKEAVALGLTEDDVTFVSCATKGCTISVTVTYDFEAVAPFISAVFDPPITSTAEMPIERVHDP